MMVMNNLSSSGECAGLLGESDEEDKRNKRDVEED